MEHIGRVRIEGFCMFGLEIGSVANYTTKVLVLNISK